jgi:hypothetical protein
MANETSTFSLTKFRTTYNSTSWQTGYCNQGYHSSNGKWVGVLYALDLRNSIAWADKTIVQFKLTISWLGIGYDNTSKTVGLYQTPFTNYSGYKGSQAIGTAIGSYNIGGYNNTKSITFNETTNTSGFNSLKNWLQQTNLGGITLYVNENEGGGSNAYSYNYCGVDSASLEITYQSNFIQVYTGGAWKEATGYTYKNEVWQPISGVTKY